jgi:hypothetical protein
MAAPTAVAGPAGSHPQPARYERNTSKIQVNQTIGRVVRTGHIFGDTVLAVSCAVAGNCECEMADIPEAMATLIHGCICR